MCSSFGLWALANWQYESWGIAGGGGTAMTGPNNIELPVDRKVDISSILIIEVSTILILIDLSA